MQITPSTLAATQVAFDTRFQAAFGSAQSQYERIASLIPSSSKSTTHAFMNKIPRLREWLGERQINNISAQAYSLENKSFENTVEVDRDDFDDDNLGVYNPLLDMIGQQAKLWPDDLVIAALKAGITELCYDGQYFFDTDHPKNHLNAAAGTQSNKFTLALTADNLATVRKSMMELVGEDGRTLGVNPNLLVVPPALEMAARKILKAEFLANGETNVMQNLADILVLQELAGADTSWYLLDTSKPIKPFIFQLRKAPAFVSLTDPTSENVFRRKTFLYGVEARGAAGYGPWFLAAKSTP